jgi:serine/threonine kinase 38
MDREISKECLERVETAKAYIEHKYSRIKEEESRKKSDWEDFQKKLNEMNLSSVEQDIIKQEIFHKEADFLRKSRQKMSITDFEPISIIGKGAYGEVRVCRHRETEEIVALKKLKKTEMKNKNQVKHVKAERDILAKANNPWIVELKYSFQDCDYLYLCMEYLPGGDLMTLLMKKDIFMESETRFYAAEMVLAIDSAHQLNYIHRDLKPDNVLLDKNGHIKLSDFGLCKFAEIVPNSVKLRRSQEDVSLPQPSLVTISAENAKKFNPADKVSYKRHRQLAYSTVGTPDYIAPEVFAQDGYNETVDWWSLGVMIFEMLIGYPPFYSEDSSITCQKIISWKKVLRIPPEPAITPEAADLILKLIRDPSDRLGSRGVYEIKSHPFFKSVDWDHIRESQAPYLPDVSDETDTQHFDKFEESEPFIPKYSHNKKYRKDMDFVGYTYKKTTQRNSLVLALQELELLKATDPNKPSK